MITNPKHTELIRWHNVVESFDYDLTIDWAIELLENGMKTENIYMLASFSKPVKDYEIKPYVSAALKDLKIAEEEGEYSIMAKIHYHLQLILEQTKVRQNLMELCKLSHRFGHEYGLIVFYQLHYAWLELEEARNNPYYKGATLENIDRVLEQEALKWIKKHIPE